MLNPMLIKYSSAMLIFLIAYSGGYLALRGKVSKTNAGASYGEAFTSGIFLGAALFHMLPESHHAFHTVLGTLHYAYGNILCAASFILLLVMDLLLQQRKQQNYSFIPLLLLSILSLHAFTEGAAFGISEEWQNIIVILFAIIAHKGSASFALVKQLLRYKEKNTTHFYLLFFALMTPLGIVLGEQLLQFTSNQVTTLITAILYAIAAGSFLYVGTLHGSLPYIMRHYSISLKTLAMLCIGLGVMAFF